MFLNQFNENEKQLFFGLCKYAVMADGVVELGEMEYLMSFFDTPALPDTNEPLEEILQKFAAVTSGQTKKMAVFELLVLLKQDNDYDESEQGFMQKVIRGLHISIDDYDALSALAYEYVTLSQKINNVIDV